MLTGLYPANGGNAWVAGFDIKTRLDQVQLQMGVCPQFDILWKDLTVKEHLLFYARLKGISPETEEAMVEKAITEVKLERFANFKTKQLSGGMRRRLSVAISLVGEPKIVFLDEPSTGLDPENRRQLWDILGEARGKRAIILTTHSMEEADVLCNRIGIVTDGVLRCVGKQIRLKTLYGGGYHLFVNCHRGRQLKIIQKENENTEEFKDSMKPEDIHQRVKDFIKGLLPNVILIQEFNGNFVFQVCMVPLIFRSQWRSLMQVNYS
jgi:ABC-type multidrug transport system ATPase subunit